MKIEAVRKCPESLRRIIAAVNRLPENTDEILERLIKLARDVENADFEEIHANIESYKAKIYNLKLEKEVLDYLIGEMPGAIIFGLVAQNFNELILAKPVLQGIAEINRKEIEQYGKRAFTETPFNKLVNSYAFQEKMRGIRFSVPLDLINGCVRPAFSGLPLIFQKEDIPLARIRICPVCKSIFWAKRIDSPTCSEKCLNTFNQRNTRIRKLEKELEKLQTNSNSSSAAMRLKEEKTNKLQKKINQRKKKYGTL